MSVSPAGMRNNGFNVQETRHDMCMKSPKMPDPPPPPQPAKPPDVDMSKMRSARRQPGMVGGSLLTSPNGVMGGVSTGKATLLGG